MTQVLEKSLKDHCNFQEKESLVILRLICRDKSSAKKTGLCSNLQWVGEILFLGKEGMKGDNKRFRVCPFPFYELFGSITLVVICGCFCPRCRHRHPGHSQTITSAPQFPPRFGSNTTISATMPAAAT